MAVPEPLARRRFVLLETRKRDGSWVGTPVDLVTDAGRAYFRTWHTAGKAKRMRNFPDVRIAPSSPRGAPKGQTFTARAVLLEGDEAEHASRLLGRRYPVIHGIVVPLNHRLRKVRTVHYELVDLAPAPDG